MNQPVLFISHDDPSQVVDINHPSYQFLTRLTNQLKRPKAVLCISAHWETDLPTITGAETLETIYDFFGFPDSYYQLDYQVKGNPELALDIQTLLSNSRIDSGIDQNRGIDHGAWCVLKPLFPKADIPILQLSVNSKQSAKMHFELGMALRNLREQGVLIIGSGTLTHNLSEWEKSSTYDMPAKEYVIEFRDWVCKCLENKEYDLLCQYETQAPNAKRSHPSPDHILPLFVAAGAAVETDQLQLLDDAYIYGSFSMASFMWA